MEKKFNAGGYTALRLIGKNTGPQSLICLAGEDGSEEQVALRGRQWEHLRFALTPGRRYRLEWEDAAIPYAYLLEQENGDPEICFLPLEPGSRAAKAARCKYHFSPIRGWMNDPNGLCSFGGQYHLFYQFNPGDQQWGNMHWGHAISPDLLHWKHLPIARFPQQELMNLPELRGGAYSGTALPEGDILHLYYTRHIGDNAKTWCREWTVHASTRDGIHFAGEDELVVQLPPELETDFRDPKVLRLGDQWIMLTGGRSGETPVVAIHTSQDRLYWQYGGIFHREEDNKYCQAECPDLIPMGEEYILIVGYHNRPNVATQIRRDVVWYRGKIENLRFRVLAQGLMDYGKDYYATQSVAGTDIVLGWNSDYGQTYRPLPGGANGTMSLPRKLFLRDGNVYTFPIAAVSTLEHDERLLTGTVRTDGSCHIRLDVSRDARYCLLLAESEQGALSLSGSEGRTELRIWQERLPLPDGEPVTQVDVYLDRSLVEIFLNGGSVAATRRFRGETVTYPVRFTLSSGRGTAVLTEIGQTITEKEHTDE